MNRPAHLRLRGLTLIELMVAMAIVAILASVAIPAYSSYVKRSRVPVGLDALSAFATRMEQRYQDTGNYGSGSCGISNPTATNFTLSCSLTNSGQGYTATATGSGTLSGYTYTVNHQGVRATTAHPNGTNSACWTIKGSTCDS